MKLESLIKQRIRKHGPISIADYMAIALSHPEHGYYMRRDPLGASGDFITAPEISQVFGEIIGAWVVAQWKKLGSPKCALTELGPGRGTLMNDMLRATKNVPGFHDAISIHLVETSPALKQKQWQTLANKHARIEWHNDISTLPQEPLLLVANEFFDALPIKQFLSIPSPLRGEGKGEGQAERMVTLDERGELCFTPTLPSPSNGEGYKLIETCEPAITITKQLAAHIQKHNGIALFIDYGYTEGSNGDTLQAIQNHAFHDVLKTPGEADLTAHVDFLTLANAARMEGLAAYGAVPQGGWLMRLGAGQRTTNLCANAGPEQQQALMSGLKRLADPAEMGELFKVLALAPAHLPKPEGF